MLWWNTDAEVRGGSHRLVVAVHAYTYNSSRMADVQKAVRDALPDADVLAPDYPAGFLSNADPVRLAEELCAIIGQAVLQRQARGGDYQDIVLIGHSLGALLVRKAFVFARGQNEDHTGPLAPAPHAWAAKVSRIILLAGVNRGWELRRKAAAMPWWKRRAFAFGAALFRWTGLGRLINSIREGTPFVVNLQIQWINLARSAAPPPLTVQLLGDTDDTVAAEDNVDVLAGADFVYLSVADTGHGNVVDFRGAAGPLRRDVFLRALTTPRDELRSEFKAPPLDVEPSVDRVVFIMHGIRDSGHWTGALGKEVVAAGRRGGQNVVVVTSSYGYFPMIDFLLQPERERNVRWFMDRYTETLAKYPNAKLSFIGHSNGTYLMASALRRYRACVFDRVVFAGSVVNRYFDWQSARAEGRLGAVQNYVATADLVVALFPAVFQQLLGSGADLGNAGHDGFCDGAGRAYQICFVRGGHGSGKVPENYPALAAFALGDDTAAPPPALAAGPNDRSGCVIWTGKLCVLVWLFLLAVVCVLVALPFLAGLSAWWAAAASAAIAAAVWQVLRWV